MVAFRLEIDTLVTSTQEQTTFGSPTVKSCTNYPLFTLFNEHNTKISFEAHIGHV